MSRAMKARAGNWTLRTSSAEVRLAPDGSRRRATVFTLSDVEGLMERGSRSGDNLNGSYLQ
ncbi:hypothetical protein ACFWPV_15680 [Streptomyces uncialis]|uniref:hypothetical protein n=1 Tax=Streptomyces uncialis TaxID=1048205 RepID=UPI0036535FB7